MTESSITDWISALSTLGATVIAGFMAFFAYKQYLQPPTQEVEPDLAKDDAAEAVKSQLVVFETSKQRTRLNVSPGGLECWLLNKRTDEDKHQWTIGKTEIQRIINDRDFEVTPGYKAQTGLFKLGKRRNWLYSKKLFPEPDYLHGELLDILRAAL